MGTSSSIDGNLTHGREEPALEPADDAALVEIFAFRQEGDLSSCCQRQIERIEDGEVIRCDDDRTASWNVLASRHLGAADQM